jgi:hypothetical protein
MLLVQGVWLGEPLKVEEDSRYKATPLGSPVFPGDPSERTYVFISTIIPGDELVKLFPA